METTVTRELTITHSFDDARTYLDRARWVKEDEFFEAKHYTFMCLITLKKLYQEAKIETLNGLPNPNEVMDMNYGELSALHGTLVEKYFEPFLPKVDFPDAPDSLKPDLEGIVAHEKLNLDVTDHY